MNKPASRERVSILCPECGDYLHGRGLLNLRASVYMHHLRLHEVITMDEAHQMIVDYNLDRRFERWLSRCSRRCATAFSTQNNKLNPQEVYCGT